MNPFRPIRSIAFHLAAALAMFNLANAAERILVEAPDRDHAASIVSMPLQNVRPGAWTLKPTSGKGDTITMQVDSAGVGWFIAKPMVKGTKQTFELVPASGPDAHGTQPIARVEGDRVRLGVGERTALVYQGGGGVLPRADIKPIFRRGGYLHPIFSPTGLMITDDYPTNHIHHHGTWFAWTLTEFEDRKPDFWNMGQGKGRVDFTRLNQTWSGPVHSGLNAVQQMVDTMGAQPKAAIEDAWTVRFFPPSDGGPTRWIFDLVSTQRCLTDAPLVLPKYHYGGLGFRGNWDWNGKSNAFFLTSNGETNRITGNETTGRWCHIGGLVDGKKTGIAILCHPSNFRAPQPMRLHPSEPFFCYAPSQGGDWKIEPGKPYISRYRFVVQDGEPDAREIDKLWAEYANPPHVTVVSR